MDDSGIEIFNKAISRTLSALDVQTGELLH